MKSNILSSVVAAGIILLCGCTTSFDYVGRSFPEKSADAPIAYFTKASQIPANKYKLMGRGLLTAPDEFDKYDIKEALVAEARKRGASAVLLVSRKKFLAAWCAAGDTAFAGPNPYKTNPYNLSPDGTPQETDSFGNRVNVGGINRRKRYGKWELHVRAQFYCTAGEMEEFIQRRAEQIDDMINAPADELENSAEKPVKSGTVKAVQPAAAPEAEKAESPQK